MPILIVKSLVIEYNGSIITCNLMDKYAAKCSKKYRKFLAPHLTGFYSLRKYGLQTLNDDEVLMRRYLILDFFGQELRSIGVL